jgi:hypothetical protein
LPAAGLIALTAPVAAALPASADAALSCGTTQPAPCTQTVHSSTYAEGLTPPPSLPAGCPSFIGTDVAMLAGTGKGVAHVTINAAGESWYTQTFTGAVTLTLYPLSQAVLDSDGNLLSLSGPPDPSQPVFTGHVTEWDGFEANRNNQVGHGTLSLDVSGGDQHVAVQTVYHFGTNAGSGAPRFFDRIVCH